MKKLMNALKAGILCGAVLTGIGAFVDNKPLIYSGGVVGGIGIGASYGLYRVYKNKKESEKFNYTSK